MKRASKAALIFSGTAFVAGAALGIVPFLEQAVERISNRNQITEAGMMVADLNAMTPGGAPRLMNPMTMRNPENSSVANAPANPTVVMTVPADPGTTNLRFRATNLNKLPGGKGFEPTAINNRGEIVGNYRRIEPMEYTIRSMDGRRMPLRYRATARPAVFRQGKFDNLPPAPGCLWTFATSINDQGVIAGAARPLKELIPLRITGSELPLPRILRWDKGGYQDLSDSFYQIPEMEQDGRRGRFNLFTGDAVFINNDGTIFIGVGSLYRWRGGTVNRFPMSYVRQINDRGVMIGLVQSLSRIASPSEPLLPPGMTSPTGGISVQPGMINTETGEKTPLGRFSDMPCAINDAGQVILSGNRAGNLSQISTWRDGKADKIAIVPSTMNCYLNNLGLMILGDGVRDWPRSERGLNPQYGPFLSDGKSLFNLQSLVTNLKGNWAFSHVVGINDRNEILVYAFEIGRPDRHALLLSPI